MKEKTPFISLVIILSCVFSSCFLSIYVTMGNRLVGKTNQTYTRVVACVSSVSPTRRTPEYVRSCYNTAEKATGVSVDRYGDGK